MGTKRVYSVRCRECGETCETTDSRTKFCSVQHRKDWNNRRAVRGAELYDLAMGWRLLRSKDPKASNEAFKHMSKLIRAYADADKAKGRKSFSLSDARERLPIAYSREGDGR